MIALPTPAEIDYHRHRVHRADDAVVHSYLVYDELGNGGQWWATAYSAPTAPGMIVLIVDGQHPPDPNWNK